MLCDYNSKHKTCNSFRLGARVVSTLLFCILEYDSNGPLANKRHGSE